MTNISKMIYIPRLSGYRFFGVRVSIFWGEGIDFLGSPLYIRSITKYYEVIRIVGAACLPPPHLMCRMKTDDRRKEVKTMRQRDPTKKSRSDMFETNGTA